MKFKMPWLVFGVYAVLIYLVLWSGYSFGLGSVLSSTNLPLKLTVQESPRTSKGVMCAGVGLTATAPSSCGDNCWQSDITWNGKTTTVKTGDKGPFIIGDYLVFKDIGVSSVTKCDFRDNDCGWSVSFDLSDVKNFYETSFMNHPNLLKLQQGSVPATVNFRSLLSVPSIGGLTIKDDTKILRSEVKYRFLDEFPIKALGSTFPQINLNDVTLGDIVTTVQPHFYCIQSVLTFGANNPNRGSTSTSQAATGIKTGQLIYDPTIPNQMKGGFGAWRQATLAEVLAGIVQKDAANNQAGNDLTNYFAGLAELNQANVDTIKTYLQNYNSLHLTYQERFDKSTSDLVAIGKAREKISELEAIPLASRTPQESEELSSLRSQVSFEEIISGRVASSSEKLDTIEAQYQEDVKKFDAALFKQAQDELASSALQSIFGGVLKLVDDSSTQSISSGSGTALNVPSLPVVGSESGGGDFLVTGSSNYVYKFLFLEGGSASYMVGANLDYSKYKLIDDQFTPFNRKIILKPGVQTSDSGSVGISPSVDSSSASWSKALTSYVGVDYLQASGLGDGSKAPLFIVFLVLGALVVWGGRF